MKEQQVVKYYVLCNKLKDIVRTGWLNWNVSKYVEDNDISE